MTIERLPTNYTNFFHSLVVDANGEVGAKILCEGASPPIPFRVIREIRGQAVRPVIWHLTRISFPFEVRIQASRSSTFRVGRSDLWLCGCFFGALPELLVVCIYERHCQSYPGARVDRLWTCNARLVPLHGTAKFMPL